MGEGREEGMEEGRRREGLKKKNERGGNSGEVKGNGKEN